MAAGYWHSVGCQMLLGLLPVWLVEAQILRQSDKQLADAVGHAGCWGPQLPKFHVCAGFCTSSIFRRKVAHIKKWWESTGLLDPIKKLALAIGLLGLTKLNRS